MNILLISNLYPLERNLSKDRNTKALHNIFKVINKYKNVKVEVIRPLMMPTEYSSKLLKKLRKKIEIDNVNVKILQFWKIPKTDFYFRNSLVRRILKNVNMSKIDIVVAHRLHCALTAHILAVKKNIPLIIGIHQSDIRTLRNPQKKLYYSEALQFSTKIGCRSYSIYKEMLKKYPYYESKLFLISSGIDSKRIVSKEIVLSKQLSRINENRKIKFVTVSSLIPLKNIDVNLRALSMLDKKIEWEYKIIGEGRERIALEKLVIELGINDNVVFMGHLDKEKVYEELELSDVFIMVSEPESFGLVYLEALAKGCITIGAYNNGIDGIIKDKVNGFLSLPRDIESLKKSLEEILSLNSEDMNDLVISMRTTILEYTDMKSSLSYYEKISEAVRKEGEERES